MLKLQEIRSIYPEYNDLTDYELSTAVHRSRYAQMPYEEFSKGFGGPLQEDKAEVAAREYNAANPNNQITAQDIWDKDRSGVMGGLQLLGEGIYDAVTDQLPEDMSRIWRGGDIDPATAGTADDVIKRQAKDKAARVPSLQEAEGSILANSLYQGPQSIATSMATGIAGAMMGGSAGSAVGPAGAIVGSMVGGGALSGVAFYRMAKDQFVEEVQQAMQRSTGRNLTTEEAQELNAAIDADASEVGLWEAGTEAISQFFTLGLVKGAGGAVLKKIGLGGMSDAIGKRALTRIPTKMAAEIGEEETTEGITYFGQEGIRQQYGLRNDAPTLGEFATEQAGPVAVGAVLQLGGMRAAQALGGRLQRSSEGVSAGEDDVERGTKLALPPSPLALPESPIAMGAERDTSTAIPMEGIDRFLPEEEYAATEKWVQEQERLSGLEHLPTNGFLSAAADAGETIDLLSWRGAEENPVFSMDALPAPKQTIPLPMAGIQSLLGLPAGSGAMPMGTQQTGLGSIAPPTDFAHPPIAPSYTERPALPMQSTQGTPQGRWAGGRSQLAYGPKPAQGIGGIFDIQQLAAMPTQAQITNTQDAPRADTMAQADALGMPAPNPLTVSPQTESNGQATRQQADQVFAPPEAPTTYGYTLPAFVSAQYTKPKFVRDNNANNATGSAVEPVKESRSVLLQQLPPESRGEARRMTNAQLRARVEAERNPVPFSEDTIGYTREDYPMPTAQGGTIFISPSERRMAPFPQVDYSSPKKHKTSNAKVAQWLLDEAKQEAAPNEWRSLMLRDAKVDNLPPAAVDDIMDILTQGVVSEKLPAQPYLHHPEELSRGHEVAATLTPKVEDAHFSPVKATSEAENDVIGYTKKSKEYPYGQDDTRATSRDEGAAQAGGRSTDQAAGNTAIGTYEEVQPEASTRVVDGRRPRSVRNLHQGEGGRSGEERAGNSGTAVSQGDGGRTRLADGTRDSDGRLLARSGTRSGRVALDFRISPEHNIGEGSKGAKYNDNIAAITLLKQIEEEGRQASPDEQLILARYVGWGGFPEVFAKGGSADAALSRRRAEMRSLLTPEEFEAARRSTTNAHYTSPQVVSAIWKAIERMGFKGGAVLEPSMGTGNFLGLMPPRIAGSSQVTGVELDSLTARIAEQLYPQQRILNQGFETARLANDSFDLAISNVPFGDYKLHDPRYAKHNLFIHDYFFARSMDLVRHGGVVAFITSTGSMNSARSLAMRELMTNKARLLAAVRLPGTAFSKNALTDVTTDIIFLQKLKEGEQNTGPSWLSVIDSDLVSEKTGKPLRNNEYFMAYPDMMLGQLADDKLYPGRTALKSDGRDMDAALNAALQRVPTGVFTEGGVQRNATDAHEHEPRMAGENIKEGAIVLSENGGLLQNIDGELRPYAAEGKKAERIKGMIAVREALRSNLSAQMQGDEPTINATRKALNNAYDMFTKQHGFINDMANRLAMTEDPDAPLLQALEIGYEKGKDGKPSTASKADVFFRRTIAQPKIIERADTPQDALFAQLATTGKIDIADMARMTGMSEDAVLEDLRGSIFKDPKSDQWQTADDYLSGNVREKLRAAKTAAKKDEHYKVNVEALEAVQPVDIAPADIRVDLGAGWVPSSVVEAFAAKVLGTDANKITARYSPAASAWSLQTQHTALSNEYGTPEKSAVDLLRQCLNMEQATVYDQISREERVLNKAATLAAREAQRKMRDDFSAWIFEDTARAEELGRLYNDTFNAIRLYEADGKHLILPGIANTIDGKAFALKDHQKNAVWRVIQKGNTLIAHAVGAGKTFEMVAAGMELKRLGMARKPLYVVPNHMLEQWSREFLQAYPAANLLVASKSDLQKDNRRKFVSRIATGNWDAVIMTHSSFGRIPVSKQRQENFIREQLGQLEDAIREEKAQGPQGRGLSENRLVKVLEKQKMRLEEKLRKLLEEGQDRKDQQVSFEELGVDFLFVDEAHNFKNLQYVTRMKRIAGLPNSSSQRATDMLLKTQFLNEVNPGRSLVFATGTPISNTVAEMYTMTRYIAPHLLKESGLEMFDAWARQFGRVVTGMEISPDGRNFRENTRFSRFTNVPELLTMFRSFADVKTRDDLDLDLPDLKGGKPVVVSVKPSAQLTAYVDDLVQRADRIRGGNVDPRQDNMLKVTSEGRLAALDMRLIDDSLSGDPSGKVARATENIYEIWKETAQHRSAQMIFCDLSVPGKHKAGAQRTYSSKSMPLDEERQDEANTQQISPDELLAASSSTSFSVYDAIKSGLMDMGVPESDIAFIHDCNTDKQKADLFKRVRSGDVRVLLGSTAKMGEGTNVQERLVALHHLDAPWKPSAVEQREGRILRQGNKNKEIQIFTYVTENSFDAYMWQLLEAKARFVSTSMKKDVTERDMEDISLTELSAAEAKAAATGDKRILEKVGLDNTITRLGILKHEFARNRRSKENEVQSCLSVIHSIERQLDTVQEDAPNAVDLTGKNFALTLGGKRYTKVSDAAKAISSMVLSDTPTRGGKVGKVGDFELVLDRYADGYEFIIVGKGKYSAGRTTSSDGAVSRIVRAVSATGFDNRIADLHDRMERNTRSLEGARKWLTNNPSFDKQGELDAAVKRSRELDEELGLSKEKEAGVLSEGEYQEDGLLASLGEGAINPSALESGVISSIAPGQFLPQLRAKALRVRANAVQRVADRLGKKAKNAAPVHAVQSFSEMPEHIQAQYAASASYVEGVYDPRSKTVWLVADNISDVGRAAEVWAHEQVVHHGLRGMLSDIERKQVLTQLWAKLGGMNNELIRELAERYEVNPRIDDHARESVMEEFLANLAEKRMRSDLTAQEEKWWQRIVDAVLRVWSTMVRYVSSSGPSMKAADIDGLLSALGKYVMDGESQGHSEGIFSPASLRRERQNNEASHVAWEHLQEDMEAWGRQVDAYRPTPSGEAGQRELLTVCRTPDVLQKLGAPDLPMTMTRDNLKKILSDKPDHGLPKGLVKQLPEALADPIMVFESATQAEAFVVLTELKHEGRSVMTAVHLDAERQRIRVNDISSAYRRGNDGWYIRQIEEGRLLYQDKNKSLAWARTKGLQLPRVRKLPARLSDDRILTEKDVVKPVKPEGDAPLASRKRGAISVSAISPASILEAGIRKAMGIAENSDIRRVIKEEDLGILSKMVSLPHWIAKQFPEFAKVYERQLTRMDERSAALKKSLESVQSIFGEKRLNTEDMSSLRDLIWKFEGQDPVALKGVEKYVVKDVLANGREILEANPAFYIAYRKWLDSMGKGTNAAKDAMLEIRKSLDADLALAHNRMAAMSEMSDDAIKEFRQSIGHVPNYFPHHRYGAYFVQAKVGKEVVYRKHFDASTEAMAKVMKDKIANEVRGEFPDAQWAWGKNTRLPDDVLGSPIDSEAMEQIIMAATSKIADKERAREIQETLTAGTADILKARGWNAHGIGRKGIPGFETEDISKILYDYKSGLNGWLTKMEAARDFSNALGKIDAGTSPNLWRYTSQYVKDMLRNSDRVDRITGTIKSVAFAWYLGGSIKTAFVNMTQNMVVGVPRLQMDVTGGGIMWLHGAQKAIVDRVTGNKGKGLTEEEARLVQELYGESVITDAFMEEVRGHLSGVTGATLWNKFTKVLGLPMSEVERFNRASLALAAFRAARNGNFKARAREKYGVTGRANYHQAKQFAADVVRDAHFVYGKANMPEFMRSNTAGRMASPMYTFRTFTHNMLAMWMWALKTQGSEGATFVAKSIGATMALGGVTALPMYATFMAICQALSGDDDDWTEAIRSWLPNNNLLRDVVCYGAPAMGGVSVGGSLKMETPITKGLSEGNNPQEVLGESIGDIIGIPYDMLVVKPSRMLDAHSKGSTWRTLEEAAPVAIKNGMQAWRLYTEGQTTMTGRPINDPGLPGARKLSASEAFGKVLGFQPVSSTKSYDAYAADKRADMVKSNKIAELTVLALKTYDTGDPAGRVAMNRKLREWNDKMRSEGKPHMLITVKDVSRRVKARRRENTQNGKAMQKKARMDAVWG